MGKTYPRKKSKGQGLVEFAIALPILLAITFGLIEFGRLLLTYTAVTASTREAARFGVGIGVNASGTHHYHDCDGMIAEGLRFGRFGGLTTASFAIDIIQINDPAISSDDVTIVCIQGVTPEVTYGDRIEVTSTVDWNSIIPFLNLPTVPISSMASKTIIKDVKVLDASVGSGTAIVYPTLTSGSLDTPTWTSSPVGPSPTWTSSPIPGTPTNTNTPHPPIAPILNLSISGTAQGGQCKDITFTWDENPEWNSIFPGYDPVRYQIYEDGLWMGGFDPVFPTHTYVSAKTLTNTQSIRLSVRALFAGIFDTEFLILDVEVNCDGGALATAIP